MNKAELADHLRLLADMLDNHDLMNTFHKFIERPEHYAAIVETPHSTNNIGELIKEAIDDNDLPPKVETPSADQLKALLQTVSRKYSSPEVRDTISNTIGDFKTANKMTDAERQAVYVALVAEYEI